MFLKSYLDTALATMLNILLYTLSVGRYIWLEGRVRGGVFHNWNHRVRYRPANFAQPQSLAEIVALVQGTSRVRVCGAGHSFNTGVVTEGTLLSLDRYSGILWVDYDKKQMAVRAGTRVRDINHALLKEGWAFAALPSHDAQSIGGIISTDVHGTGREWGFVSQSVVSLKVVDGRGQLRECEPHDELFKAAIGGIGAAGIIVEVVVQAVEAFNVIQKTELRELDEVEANLERLLAENEHLSLYVFPYGDKCQVNTWNRTRRERAFVTPLKEFVDSAVDALIAVWLADLLAHLRLLPRLSAFVLNRLRGSELVLESSEGFNRTVYYPHHELEFAVPYEETWPTLRRFVDLYRRLYPEGMPFVAFELRFTPAGHERTLIGPGRGRRTTWIDLLCSDSAGYERFLEVAEREVKAIGARPHLGKHCRLVDRAYLEAVHGDYFSRFRALAREHDPHGKFVNDFTRRLFALESEPAEDTPASRGIA